MTGQWREGVHDGVPEGEAERERLLAVLYAERFGEGQARAWGFRPGPRSVDPQDDDSEASTQARAWRLRAETRQAGPGRGQRPPATSTIRGHAPRSGMTGSRRPGAACDMLRLGGPYPGPPTVMRRERRRGPGRR